MQKPPDTGLKTLSRSKIDRQFPGQNMRQTMNKLTDEYQKKFTNQKFVNNQVRNGISDKVKLHEEINNVRSSAAACLNVMGYLNQHQKDIIPFFNKIRLNIQTVIPFPSNVNFEGIIYDDKGPIVFEWIGPKKSPINEKGGSRGQNRTSIDAFMLAEIDGKVAQLLIEWKFTEQYNSESYTHKFGGKKGIERLRRYSIVLAELRKNNFPFNFKEEGKIGLADFSYEPFYQLLRMTLLAKMTTPISIGGILIEDYKIIHLSHSENKELNILTSDHLKYSPGLNVFQGKGLHETWMNLLSDKEKSHHIMSYWNTALSALSDNRDKKYLIDRYE